jgi:hypothetical protein
MVYVILSHLMTVIVNHLMTVIVNHLMTVLVNHSMIALTMAWLIVGLFLVGLSAVSG